MGGGTTDGEIREVDAAAEIAEEKEDEDEEDIGSWLSTPPAMTIPGLGDERRCLAEQ